jgi:hypothetical protein
MKSKTTTTKSPKEPAKGGTTTLRHNPSERAVIDELAKTLRKVVKGMSKNRALILTIAYVARQLKQKTIEPSDVVVTQDSDQ